MYSYGSGCAASIYTLKVVSNKYLEIRDRNFDTTDNLSKRIKISPSDYEKFLLNKEKLYLRNNYESTVRLNISKLLNSSIKASCSIKLFTLKRLMRSGEDIIFDTMQITHFAHQMKLLEELSLINYPTQMKRHWGG